MHKIIGISGYKGHGKDYFAKYIQNLYPEFKILHFAKKLKKICSEVFKIPENEFNSSFLKEKKYNNLIDIDNYINELKELTGLNLLPRGLKASSHRELLQYIGTEYVRSVDCNYWVNYLIKYIINNPGNYLIPDTRFSNEAECLIKHNGCIVMVFRPDIDKSNDNHSSENLDSLKPYVNLFVVAKKNDKDVLNMASKIIIEMNNKTKKTIKSIGYEDYEI